MNSTEQLINSSFDITSHDNVKEEFIITQKLSRSRYPVFIARSRSGMMLAAKVFVQGEKKPSFSYMNESRFLNLVHQNVISIKHKVDKFGLSNQRSENFNTQKSSNFSLIFMELAFCDLSQLIPNLSIDEKLARSFFHQIFNGLSYLHSKEIAHMDLKFENILLGSDLKLKLADFDSAYKKGDLIMSSEGTKEFRAPEVIDRECREPYPSDIFSLGVILFCLVVGKMPYNEDHKVKGFDLFNTMLEGSNSFWKMHRAIHGWISDSEEFRSLFLSMVCREPSKRATLDQIKQSKWYNQPVYSDDELESILKDRLPRNIFKEL